MNNNQKNNLTEGSIIKKLLLVAVPIMGTQLMQMAYNLVDMYFLGRIGADAVAASGTAGMYMWLSMGPMMVSRTGAEVSVAQSFGRRDIHEAKSIAQNALALALALGLCYAFITIMFREQLVGFFGIQEKNVVSYTEQYLMIVSNAIPLTYLTAVWSGLFNASGNSRTPFYCSASGLALNIMLDPLFIFHFKMGIAGAAWATVISQTVVCVAIFLCFRKSKMRPFDNFSFKIKLKYQKIKQIVKIGFPVGVESLLFTFLTMLINRILAGYGSDALALMRVGSQIESLSWLIGGGFSVALMAFVAQNVGAKKPERIRKCLKIGLMLMLIWETIVTIALFVWGKDLFYIFLPDPTLQETAKNVMRIIAVCQLFMALETVYGAVFKGTGNTAKVAVASAVPNVLRVGIAYLLASTSLGVYGVFWAATIGASLRGVWMWLWYWKLDRQNKIL